ncbi:MAG: choice-of-anchor Q domain-containing protein [Pirellulaceae bacterium]
MIFLVLRQPPYSITLLGPLADNGGPTPTHALLTGSPAIDAGNNTLANAPGGNDLTTDQRAPVCPHQRRRW